MVTKFKIREISDFAFSEEWLGDSMLFVAGPRQCGKTSLAREFLKEKDCPALYYNWDVEKIRRRYRADPDFIIKDVSRLEIEKPYVVLDEIHKLTRWKNILKGLFDENHDLMQIIVTGSARLDLFRRSGDSLVGRYSLVHLFPFSLREWVGTTRQGSLPWLHEESDWNELSAALDSKLADGPRIGEDLSKAYLYFGPFPVPLISGSDRLSRKWHRDYITLLVREDLRDITGLRELDRVAYLIELLPHRIGNPLSLRNLGEDLEANHTTVKNWLYALNKLYLVWPLTPFSAKIHRSMRRDAKWYFLDWTYAGEESAQFENMIATALYRFTMSLNDRGWPELKLHYLRTYDNKEVDFILTRDGKPVLAIEAKLGGSKLPSQLTKLQNIHKSNFPKILVINEPGVFIRKRPGEYILGFDRLLMAL